MCKMTNYLQLTGNMVGTEEDIFNNLLIHSIDSEALMIQLKPIFLFCLPQ